MSFHYQLQNGAGNTIIWVSQQIKYCPMKGICHNLTDFKILTYPNAPMDGVRVAMIEHDGAPIELMEFDENR